MTNKPFLSGLILSAIFVLLFSYSVDSTQLETSVETEYGDLLDQIMPQHMLLSPSLPSIRSLEKNQVDYYKIFIVSRYTKLKILQNMTIGHAELFVSLDPTNQYPSELEYTYTTKTANTNWIELSKKDLTKACVTQSATLCAIYVAVIPQGAAVSYSISVESSFSKNAEPFLITPLGDGSQLILLMPGDNLSANYYFYTSPFQPSFVTIETCSHYKEAVAYAKVLDRNTDLSSILDMDMPTNSSYDYVSEENMLTLSTGAQVLVVLSVYFIDTAKNKYPRPFFSPDYYFIGLEFQIVPITLGKQYTSTILPYQYRYFSVYIRDECDFMVLVKSLEGKELSFVLGPPDGDELPTIENSNFKVQELYGAKFYELQIRTHHPGRDPKIGTWTIGVYGQSSSEFTLLAGCQGLNILQLQRDKTTAAWRSSTVSPIYFLYKPETNNPISASLSVTRCSSDLTEGAKCPLSYYIRQFSKDEDFIFNRPNKTNYQWSSLADINLEICDDCIYLIGIEGGLKFDITISELQHERMEATNGCPVTNNLLPGNSNVIALLQYSYPDVYISITSEAEKLELYASNDPDINTDNYLWKIEIACNNQSQLLKLPRLHNSEDTRYRAEAWLNLYLQIRNPNSQNVSYTLMILATEERFDLIKKWFVIDAKATGALVLYPSKENETIEFNIDASPYRYSPEIGDANVEMKGYYWTEDVLGIPAVQVPITKINVFTEKTNASGEKKIRQQQIFQTSSKISKFVFLMTHTANNELAIEKEVYTLANEILALDENSQTNLTLVPENIQAYNFSFKGPGIWYLSGYSCSQIKAHLTIQNDSETQETNLTRVGPGAQVFYKATISEGESSRMVKLALSESNDMTGFILRSTFLPRAVPYYDELKKDWRTSNIKVDKLTGVILVEIYPAEFDGYDTSQDTVFYEVLTCSGLENQFCGVGKDCISKTTKEFKLQGESKTREEFKEQPEIKMEFTLQQPGEYSVTVIAHIKSQGQEIRSLFLGEAWERVINVDNQEDRQKSIEL